MTELEVIAKMQNHVLERPDSIEGLSKSYIRVKLLELRDALLQWAVLIEEKEKVIILGERSIIFDVAWTIFGKKPNLELIDNEFFKKNTLPLSQHDKVLIYSYINWKMHESQIRERGYSLPCPYIPYLDLFRAGSRFLSYQHNLLEACNVGVWVDVSKAQRS